MSAVKESVDQIKNLISERVESMSAELDALSKKIHGNPELGYEENKACEWLCAFLEAKGFKVERGVADLKTAFRATIENGDGPTIAILCEYDALPDIGHACGHNIIGTAGAGAGAALAALKEHLPKGRIQVIGTPAEEGGGGKVEMIERGVFKEVDCAMMIHGFDQTILHMDFLGVVQMNIEFTGKASHASAAPWNGVNALDACIQLFNNVAMLRQQVRPDCRIHGIITNGGAKPNIIPEYASAFFYIRAPKLDEMWDLHKRVAECAEGAAKATGATVKITQVDNVYEPFISSKVMLDFFAENLDRCGLKNGVAIPGKTGSSDIGNVSQVVPTIHPMIATAPEGMSIHTREFAEAAISPLALNGLKSSAKCMAMTTLDLMNNPEKVKEAKAKFKS